MESIADIVNNFYPLTIFGKLSILDVRIGSWVRLWCSEGLLIGAKELFPASF